MKIFINKLVALLAIWILVGDMAYGLDDISFGNDGAAKDEHVYGTGIVSLNIDNDPRPDYISCHTHSLKPNNGQRNNTYIECSLAKNTNRENGDASWQHTGTYTLGSPFSEAIDGLGVAIGDVDGDENKDLVLAGVVNGKLHYRIAKNLEENGHTGQEEEFIVDSKDIKYVKGTWEVKGLGISLYDLDHNGKQELLVTWISDGHSVAVEFAVLWNLDKNGKYDKLTQQTVLQDLSNVNGLGIEVLQLDDNPAPDLYYAYREGEFYRSEILYNIDSRGEPKRYSHAESRRLTKPSEDNSVGMGVALSEVDGHFVYDATISYPYDPLKNNNNARVDDPNIGLYNSRKVIFDTQMDSVKTTEKIEKIKTKERIELVKHLGHVISVIKDESGILKYSVMKDNEEWTTPTELKMSNFEEDTSVQEVNNPQSTVNSKSPIQYNYTPIKGYKKFHLISDGEYLYLFYTNNSGKLFTSRYILDKVTNELVVPYDIRYSRSGMKCEPAKSGIDTVSYKDMDGKLFYEPTIEITYLFEKGIKVDDFSVHILPTSLADEERWQIFALDTSSKVHELSFRKAKKDLCDINNSRVYFKEYFSDKDKVVKYDDNGTEKEIDLEGVIYHKFTESTENFKGLSSTLYSNQQKCDGEMVKREQRIKLILSGNDHMTEVDYAINGIGSLISFDSSKNNYKDRGCDADNKDKDDNENSKSYSYINTLKYASRVIPFIYESSDGFLHLLFSDTVEYQFHEMIYDTYVNRWVTENDREHILNKISGGAGKWYGEYKRSPWYYYKVYDSEGSANAIEYGSYSYDSNGTLVGEMKRLSSYYNRDNYTYILREKIGTLKTRYIGQNMIDATLIGYIEGAPPIPQKNFTEEDDYDDATSVGIVEATSLKQTYVQSKDWGMDFESDGNVGPAAFSIDTSYSWLSENSVAYENVETIGINQSLKGEWNEKEKEWQPYNIGTALIKAKKANIYGIYFEDDDNDDTNDRLFAYKTVPVAGSEKEQLTSFVINPKYIKNGDLESYKKDKELEHIEKEIKNREERIRAYYKQYKSTAFTSIPELDSISKRNIINEYYWSATGGTRSKAVSYSTSMSESLGGSFHFQGMAGVALADPLFGSFTLNVLAGAHIDKTFSKTEDSESSFEMNLEADIESKGIIDGQLEAFEPNSKKIDYFKWKTAYLEPSADNFNDFFDKVVDPEWLKRDNVYAKRLREARNRSNRVWRIRHFVTFFSNPYKTKK